MQSNEWCKLVESYRVSLIDGMDCDEYAEYLFASVQEGTIIYIYAVNECVAGAKVQPFKYYYGKTAIEEYYYHSGLLFNNLFADLTNCRPNERILRLEDLFTNLHSLNPNLIFVYTDEPISRTITPSSVIDISKIQILTKGETTHDKHTACFTER